MDLIIPTLWQPANLVETLEHYLATPAVQRLVLIDNAPWQRPAAASALQHHPRLLLLNQRTNLYVNPAWNLGMAQIPPRKGLGLVGILNDDIYIPGSVLELLLGQMPGPGAVVGLLPADDANSPFALEPFPYRPEQSIGSQCRGFGSALFLHRDDFKPIPEQLQIWFGDDWILRHARQVIGLRSSLIQIDRHVTMAAMRASQEFRQQLASDKRQAAALLGLHG